MPAGPRPSKIPQPTAKLLQPTQTTQDSDSDSEAEAPTERFNADELQSIEPASPEKIGAEESLVSLSISSSFVEVSRPSETATQAPSEEGSEDDETGAGEYVDDTADFLSESGSPTHDAEDEGHADRHQEQHQAKLHAVEKLLEQERTRHGGSVGALRGERPGKTLFDAVPLSTRWT